MADEQTLGIPTIGDERIALPEETLVEAAGVSVRRLRRWDEEFELARPGIVREISKRNIVRLYRFEDAVEVLVVKALLDRGHSMYRIRKLVGYLREHAGYSRPLREVKFAVPKDEKDKEIYIQHDDGTWVGDRQPAHQVLYEVLVLDEVRAIIREASVRRSSHFGATERKRGRQGSREVFSGTRIPVDVVLDYIKGDAKDEEILAAFPSLRAEDLEVARRRLTAAV